MKVYIDNDYKCHVSDDGTMREIQSDFFDGKSVEFIEGYRYIPPGETWTRSDGEIFTGRMISPWKNYDELDNIQRVYDLGKMDDAENALAILLGGGSV